MSDPEFVQPIAEWCAATVEMAGIAVITLFALYSLVVAAFRILSRQETSEQIFRELRQRLGRGILLGLELLVAADIIHTVAVELSFETVGVLSIIVLIRTFLSFTLAVELTGKLPWQHDDGGVSI